MLVREAYDTTLKIWYCLVFEAAEKDVIESRWEQSSKNFKRQKKKNKKINNNRIGCLGFVNFCHQGEKERGANRLASKSWRQKKTRGI